jgi:hypothetical protein
LQGVELPPHKSTLSLEGDLAGISSEDVVLLKAKVTVELLGRRHENCTIQCGEVMMKIRLEDCS